MSTTQQPGEQLEPTPPSDVFEESIASNRDVCNECYERIRYDWRTTRHSSDGHDKRPKRSRAVIQRKHATKVGEIGPEGPILSYEPDGGDNPEISTYPNRTVCEQCGSVGGRADDEPCSRRVALERAERLAERLSEVGEPVETETLKYCVGRLKSLEDYASKDRVVFEAATTVAVRKSR